MRKLKSVLVAIVLIFASVNVFSQDFMDEIAIKACECIQGLPDTLTQDQINMQLGICMIEVATPYKKQLRKEYSIDLNKIDTQGEDLGRIIGLKMATVCPDLLMRMVNKVNDTDESSENEYKGVVTNIDENQFVVFSVKDNNGKISKFYWLTFIDSDIEMSTEYKSLNGEYVNVSYIEQEFFDSRIGEYRNFNIILKIEHVLE